MAGTSYLLIKLQYNTHNLLMPMRYFDIACICNGHKRRRGHRRDRQTHRVEFLMQKVQTSRAYQSCTACIKQGFSTFFGSVALPTLKTI
jgi:hypothetical protein